MATCSQASSLAPQDFRLFTSFDESQGAISVAVEYCQLCCTSRKPFYCVDCINKGDFVHSTTQFPETQRYADKQNRWQILKSERLKLLEKFKKNISQKGRIEEKREKIRQAKYRNLMLQKAVESAEEAKQKDTEKLKKHIEDNNIAFKKQRVHKDKLEKICEYLGHKRHKRLNYEEQLLQCYHELGDIRRQHVQHLSMYIFPIEEVQCHRSESDSVELDTVSALAEARRTAYIRGRWVYTDNGGEHHYRVVEPTLPGNGDYSAYTLWLSENRETLPADGECEMGEKNAVHTIEAALSYTSQLLCLLAYFLDINLPKQMCYSDFCSQNMTERHFAQLVNKLNHNVLHVCFTQYVNPENLHPKHTIHNVQRLLNSAYLGRSGFFEVSPELMQSIEENHDTDSSSEDDTVTCDPDWETVPSTDIPEAEIPTPSPPNSQMSSAESGMQTTTTSIAGGLMSSALGAVAGATSWWRAATGRKDGH